MALEIPQHSTEFATEAWYWARVAVFSVRGLYPIVDVDACLRHGVEPLAVAEAILEASPSVLQLRAKSATSGEVFTWLRALRVMTKASATALVVDDRPDLAVAVEADAVHLGREDMSLADARRFAPELGVGVSTHTLDELERAILARPEYVALGPIFETSTKGNPDPVLGIETLARAHAAARDAGIPLVAIGGISSQRFREVAPYCDAAAVIGALFEAGTSRCEMSAQARRMASAFS